MAIHDSEWLTKQAKENQMNHDGEYWHTARPINYQVDSWWSRISQAWGVLLGRYDCVYWQGQ